MPPAAPFLVPARKGEKNRPEGEDSESLPPLDSPHSNGQKGSSPFWKSPCCRVAAAFFMTRSFHRGQGGIVVLFCNQRSLNLRIGYPLLRLTLCATSNHTASSAGNPPAHTIALVASIGHHCFFHSLFYNMKQVIMTCINYIIELFPLQVNTHNVFHN